MSVLSAECKYLTEDCIREWKNSSSNFRLPNPVPALRFLYELCASVVRGELPLQKCKAIVESVEFSDKQSKEEMASLFADIIAQMGLDLTMPVECRARLVKMAKWLVDSALVPVRLFHERCEEEFLWESEMCRMKAQDVKGKEIRANTRLLYLQTKFNLLREESEGYAKLVSLLCQSGSEAKTRSTSMAKISIIKSLIGHFDLDPNRVFDIVLECFELQPDNNIFFDLIPIFPKSHASQILGFKFQYYQRMEVNNPVPFGLYRLTAMLVKLGFIDLDNICAHLLPKDDEAFEHYSAFAAKRFDEANKIGKINLAATGKDLMDDEKQGDVTIDFYAALDMENEAVAERATELANNQSLGLLNGFLYVDDWQVQLGELEAPQGTRGEPEGDLSQGVPLTTMLLREIQQLNEWYHAHIMFDRLALLNPVAHIPICEGLFRLIEESISPAYAKFCETHLQASGSSLGSSSDAMEAKTLSLFQSSFIDLARELFQMLASAGPYFYRNTVLLQKVCRVLRGYYLSALELFNTSGVLPDSGDVGSRDPHLQLKEARLRVEEALGTCLLPSLQLIPANPAVGQEIWELMSLLPYEARYRLYGEWEKDDERIPMVLAARQTAKLDTRRILKRLAKENLKQLGRMVAKLAHANPMTVLRTIVHQIEAYRDMITPVVDAFKYLTQLEYDVLEYVVIERLAQGGREKLKDDGLNLSDWLQSLASFWGHLCKKYPSMELRGLFQYLVNQLKKGTGVELVLLQELIQQMANVQYTENMTEEQLDAMAGSETLRYQATSFGIMRNNKALIKSTNRLRDSLLPKEEPKLAIPLLLLIAQHRSMVVTNADAPYIKMVSEQFDRCHGTLLQYVEFLYSAVTPATAYAQLIPSLDDLIHKYHLDPEVAFLIYRPVMRLFKCSSGLEVFWPSDVSDDALMSNADKDSESLISNAPLVLDLGSHWKPITWSDLLDTIRSILPLKAWNSLSPDLYATFWGLTLYDLYVPRNRYESEIAKQHAALKALEELSDNSNSAITKRKKEKERIQELLDRLTSELQKHEENVASVRQRLVREKDKWLSSCPDTLKINMEFLQRCIFPRCIFSMPDAVYCAMFVHTLHSLGTPFFNTVNHIDVLICKTLQPMICCCTEYEAGRLGRFLYETLKMAYHWKSDESIYERECGNMPGFAVYYRYPNSQRVAFSQFIRVHWKWGQRITRLLIQCLESTEYMEIRNSLILLTKISGVFPVTRKSGINLEKRVAKIKGDEREDLKVLATGVAAALAARKSSWISEEEFGMGHLDLKPAPSPAKSLASNVTMPNGSAINSSQNENAGSRNAPVGNQLSDPANLVKDIARTKAADGRSESITQVKLDSGQPKQRGGQSANGADFHSITPATQPGTSRPVGIQKTADEHPKGQPDENMVKAASKASLESEARSQTKRSTQTGSLMKQKQEISKDDIRTGKQELAKDDIRTGKSVARAAGPFPSSASDKDLSAHPSEARQSGNTNGGAASASVKVPTARVESGAVKTSEHRVYSGKDMDDVEFAELSRLSSSRSAHSPLHDDSSTALKSVDKQQKRTSPAGEPERLSKRRKGDTEVSNGEGMEIRLSSRERGSDPRQMDKLHLADFEKSGIDDHNPSRLPDNTVDRSKDKGNERYDRDHKERLDRPEKPRGDDLIADKTRDRSIERYGRERSIERMQERGTERSFDRATDKAKDDRNREDRNKLRSGETSDDRFHGQNLPPPPPIPPNVVPQSLAGSRRDEEDDRRAGSSRHVQRLSPRHAEKERRRSEESLVLQDDAKRRREDDLRERKRDEREGMSMKVEERDRDKGSISKEDMDAAAAASKRRKLKRDHQSPADSGGEYQLAVPPPPSHAMGISPQQYDGRESGDRKGAMVQRAAYMDDPVSRVHGKEAASKITRRDNDQPYDRDWEEEKRQRVEPKRRHRKEAR